MKIASRYLLLLEIYLSIIMLSWAWSGWHGNGALWIALAGTEENNQWGVVMTFIGLCQLVSTSSEWLTGRHWCNRTLFINVSNRMVCLFVSVAVWFYAFYKILMLDSVDVVSVLGMQSIAGMIFCALAFAGNLKVRLVLHPKVPTSNLEKTIIMDRTKLMKW